VTSRTRKRSTAAALGVVAALALSGCNVHPGSAAVVNGSAISQSKVDDLVLAACSFTRVERLSNGQLPAPSTSMAYLRHVLLQDLITVKIADAAAKSLHLSVSPAVITTAAGNTTVPAGVSNDDRKLLQAFFLDLGKSQAHQAVIGAHIKDPSITNADKLFSSDFATDIQAAAKFMSAFTRRQNVSINPAYGSWNNQVLVDGDGSLSVPKSATAVRWLQLRRTDSQNVSGLPPSQVCG